MGLNLFLHHQSLNLFEKLNSNLTKSLDNPFESEQILTPNYNVSEWIKLKLTESRGILGNFCFSNLESFLWKIFSQTMINQRLNYLKGKSIERLSSISLTSLIYEAFLQEPTAFPILRSYFQNKKSKNSTSLKTQNEKPITIQSTQVQLFHQLALLFLEYQQQFVETNQQKGFEQTWFKSQLFFSKKSHKNEQKLEQEQRELYQFIFSKNGLLEKIQKNSDTYIETLPRLLEKIQKNKFPIETSCIHVFNFSRLTLFHRKALLEISLSNSVYLYNLTPCLPIWENIPNKNILNLWGIAGRENFILWQETTQWAYSQEENNIKEDRIKSSLQHLQNTVFQPFDNLKKSNLTECDPSLQLWKTNSVEDELLTTHQNIRALLKKDPKLHPNEISIILPRMENYKSKIQSIFYSFDTNDPNYVPFHIIDQNSNLIELPKALKSILNVFSMGLNRVSFFNLISNPLVMQKHNLKTQDIESWSSFCEQLNLFDNQKESLYGFDKVLERYLLQDFLTIEEKTKESVDLILILWKTLSNNLIYFKQLEGQPWEKICQGLINIFNFWIQIPIQESFAWEQVLSILNDIQIRQTIHPKSKTVISEFWAIVSHFLKIISFESAQFLMGGVVIASSKDLNSIPFKHTFILGLNFLDFPSQDKVSHLNLVQLAQRKMGQVTTSMAEKYSFLENILETQSSLVLSYNALNLKKDLPLSPSIVIKELQEHIKEYCNQTFKETVISTSNSESQVSKTMKNKIQSPSQNENKHPFDIKEFTLYLKNPLLYNLHQKLKISSEKTIDENFLESKGYNSSPLDLFCFKKNYWKKFTTICGRKVNNLSSFNFFSHYQEFIEQGKSSIFPFQEELKNNLWSEFSAIQECFLREIKGFSHWIPSISLGKSLLASGSKHYPFVRLKDTEQKIQGEIHSIFIKKTETQEEWIHPIFSSSKTCYLDLLYPFFFYRLTCINHELPNHFKIIIFHFDKKHNKVNCLKYSISKNKPLETVKFFTHFQNILKSSKSFNFPFQQLFPRNPKNNSQDILTKIQKEDKEISSHLNTAQIISEKNVTEKDLDFYYENFENFLIPLFKS